MEDIVDRTSPLAILSEHFGRLTADGIPARQARAHLAAMRAVARVHAVADAREIRRAAQEEMDRLRRAISAEMDRARHDAGAELEALRRCLERRMLRRLILLGLAQTLLILILAGAIAALAPQSWENLCRFLASLP